mgnify:CR=1 FL=1
MKKLSIVLSIAFLIIVCNVKAQETGSFTDSRDSKIYKTVKIGTQIWMAENLAYKASSGCWAYENDSGNVKKYGYLYDWKTAKNACPSGWHLPTDSEWLALTNFLGGGDVAGGKLKSTIGWESPNTGATNSSGFSALPSGARFTDGLFDNATGYCYYWRTKEFNNNDAYFIQLSYDQKRISENYEGKNSGLSVRCIKNKD